MQPLTAQNPYDGRRVRAPGSLAGEPGRERLPVSAHCPGCGRSRLIYTTLRAHVSVMLTCPACRGTSSDPRR